MGARTRPPLFTARGGGEGGGKESREPGEKPRTVAKPGFPGAPHLVSRGERRKFPPLGRQGLPGDWQRPPPAQGCAWGRWPILGPTLTPLFICKHLLRAYYVPRFSTPQGDSTKTLPNVKSQLGGPQEDGRDQNNSWPGQRRLEADPPWEKWQSSSISEHGLAPLALPHIPRVGEEEKKDSDNFSSLLGTLISFNLCHRPQSRPQVLPLHGNPSTSLPPSLGHPRACDKGQTSPVPTLFHPIHTSAPPHMLLIPAGLNYRLFPLPGMPTPCLCH